MLLLKLLHEVEVILCCKPIERFLLVYCDRGEGREEEGRGGEGRGGEGREEEGRGGEGRGGEGREEEGRGGEGRVEAAEKVEQRAVLQRHHIVQVFVNDHNKT